MKTKLLLIRHGQTNCNLEKRYSGFLDVDINATGKKQAKLLHKRLKKIQIHNVYSSDRLRAINSAKIIFKNLKVSIDPGLRELHFGIFEGLTYAQIMKKHPQEYKKWLVNPFKTSIPQGENLYDFQKRILTSFKNIISNNIAKTAAIVCHGGVISIFINSILKSKDFWNYIPDSTSLSIVERIGNNTDIKLFNDTTHLNHI